MMRAAWLGTLLLAGCVRHVPVPVDQARASMIGRPAEQIAQCMGNPPLQRSRGSTTLWSYPSPAATQAAPASFADPASANFQYSEFSDDPLGQGLATGSLGVSEGPAAPSGCIVNVTLDGGRVAALTFVGPNGRRVATNRECSELVRPCLH